MLVGMAAGSCFLKQLRPPCSTTVNCSLLTWTCRRFHSSLRKTLGSHQSARLQSWREAIVWLNSQSSRPKLVANPNVLLRCSTHRLCHIGASDSAAHLPRSLTPRGIPVAGLHTLGLVMAPREEKRTKPKSDTHGSVLMEMIKSQDQPPRQLTVGDKVVQAGKDFTYLIVIAAGFVVAGFLLWSVGSEFFSQNSPSVVYSRALKRVKSDPQVIEVLGEPISGHGAPSGRGRRRDVLHQEYIVDDETYMRVKFFVDGSKRKGTVHVDLKKNQQGKYDCRFLYVELKGHPAGTIVLEDNR